MSFEDNKNDLKNNLIKAIDNINDELKEIQKQKYKLELKEQELINSKNEFEIQLSLHVNIPKQPKSMINNNINDTKLVRYYTEFKWDNDVQNSLKNIFKLKKLRKYQKPIINCLLLKHDCFVILPSGGGKSLCYQLPPTLNELYNKGITIVISPLLSLIEDQVYHLNKLNIKCAAIIGSDKENKNNIHIMNEIGGYGINLSNHKKSNNNNNYVKPRYKLIYTTPEKLTKSSKLLNRLERAMKYNYLSRFIIDEAHCISEWGHDFRPNYKHLSILRYVIINPHLFPNVSVLWIKQELFIILENHLKIYQYIALLQQQQIMY